MTENSNSCSIVTPRLAAELPVKTIERLPTLRHSLMAIMAVMLGILPARATFSVGMFEPAAARPGESVVFTGAGFDPASSYTVTISGIATSAIDVAEDGVTFTMPAAAVPGMVTISDGETTRESPLPLLVLRDVSGRFVPPPGMSAEGFQFVTGQSSGSLGADGTFVATVSIERPSLVWVFRDGIASTFLALITDSMDPIIVDLHSTALAQAAANPAIGLIDSDTMDTVRQAVAAHSRFGDVLALVESAVMTSTDYLDDGRMDVLLTEILIDVQPAFPEIAELDGPFKESPEPGVRLRDFNLETKDAIFNSRILTDADQPNRFVVLENKTARSSRLDWTMELFRVKNSEFPGGLEDVIGLSGASVLPPADSTPIGTGFQRASLITSNVDLFKTLIDATAKAIVGNLGQEGTVATNRFRIPIEQEGIYLLQSYSGNLPNALSLQAHILDKSDPNGQWATTLATNLIVVALDAASVFIDSSTLTGVDNSYFAGVIKDVAKALTVYRGRGELDAATIYDFVKTTAISVMNTLVKSARKIAEPQNFLKRAFKFIGRSVDILGKVASGLKAIERTTGLIGTSTMAIERSLLVVGKPFAPVITAVDSTTIYGGQKVVITGRNFSWNQEELAVSFCRFVSQSSDDVHEDSEIPAELLEVSPTRIVVRVPSSNVFRTKFPNSESYLCVSRAGELDSTRSLSDAKGLLKMPPPAVITEVEPKKVVSGAIVSIIGTGFTDETSILLDLGTRIGITHRTPTRIEGLLPTTFTGNHSVSARTGDETSAPFTFEVIAEEIVNVGLPPGVDITITKLDMTNQPDGEISVAEAFLIANGTLGRAIEQHVEDEPAGTQRETDHVIRDTPTGEGGGAGVADTVRVALALQQGTAVVSGALPAITRKDQFFLSGLTLLANAGSASQPALRLDDADQARIENVILDQFKGPGISLTNGTSGALVRNVTVKDGGGAGISLADAEFCQFESIEILNANGTGLDVAGVTKNCTFTGFKIDSPEGVGVKLSGNPERNTFSDFTVTKSMGDGLLIEGGALSNQFQNRFHIAETRLEGNNGNGVRLSGSEVAYNALYTPGFTGINLEAVNSFSISVADCSGYGIVIEKGASHNMVVPSEVSNCTKGGILVTGSGTQWNKIGRLYWKPTAEFNDNLQFTKVRDNSGPGITLSDASSHTFLTGLNISGSGKGSIIPADGILVDGSSSNTFLTIYSGFDDPFDGSSRTVNGNTGHGMAFKNADDNLVSTAIEVTVFEFGDSITERFINQIANEGGDGIRFESGCDRNRVLATHISAVGGNGISLIDNSTGNNIGSDDIDEIVEINAAVDGVLLDGGGTKDNRLHGLTITSSGIGDDQMRFGILVRNRATGNQLGDIGPMGDDTSGFGGRPRNESIRISGAREAGVRFEDAGALPGNQDDPLPTNRLHNCLISACNTGIWIADNSRGNEIGGLLGGGPKGGGFVLATEIFTEQNNTVIDCMKAGLRFTNVQHSSPDLRNVIQNLSILMTLVPPANPPDLSVVPDRVGILIESSCEGVVVGENRDIGIRVSGALAGVYIDGAAKNIVRATTVSSFGPSAAGIVVVSGQDNLIGGSGGDSGNIVESIRFNNELSPGILIAGGEHNTIRGNQSKFCGHGIVLEGTINNLIGGSGVMEGNVFAGNAEHGIVLESSSRNVITSNFIGIDRNGAKVDPELDRPYENAVHGMFIEQGSANNQIGGNYLPGISGRRNESVLPFALPIPAENTISNNRHWGIVVDGTNSIGNSILSNSIFANGDGGISLLSGGNSELEAPLGSYDFASNSAFGSVPVSHVPAGSRIQLFSDNDTEGEILIGETTVKPGGAWTVDSVVVFPFPNVTATVTHGETGSTSPFGVLEGQPTGFVIGRAGGGTPVPRVVAFSGDIVAHSLELSAIGAAAQVAELTLHASGSLDEVNAITGARIVYDVNENGKVDPTDPVLTQLKAFTEDDGEVTFDLDKRRIEPGFPQRWLVAYEPAEAVTEGTSFALEITDAAAIRAQFFSPASVAVSPTNPFPVRSDMFTVGQPPAESGFDRFIANSFQGIIDPAIIGRSADPDSDGVSNLLEWVLGGNPAIGDAGAILPRLVNGENGDLVFQFRRRTDLPAEVTTAVTVAVSPPSFTINQSIVGSPMVTANEDGTETIAVPVKRSDSPAQAWLRLEVNAPAQSP